MQLSSYEGVTQRLEDVQGVVLDRQYTLVDTIAETGTCIIYKAYDLYFNRHVLIKQLRPVPDLGCPNRMQALTLLRREARFLALSQSTYTPQLCKAVFDTYHPYIVLEFFDGITLEQRLRWIAPSRREALLLCDRICTAIIDLHDQQPAIIHGDLSLKNLMLLDHKRVKVIDLGLSRRPGERAPLPIAVGTQGFASPEQCANGALDQASDVYALGMVFHKLLGTEISPALQHVVERATAWEAAQRYPSVTALQRALRTAATPRVKKPTITHRTTCVQWLITLLLVVLICGFVVFGIHRKKVDSHRSGVDQLVPVPAYIGAPQR